MSKIVNVNSIEGLEHIRDKLENIAMWVYRDGKWLSLWLSEMTTKEVLDTIIEWTKQNRVIHIDWIETFKYSSWYITSKNKIRVDKNTTNIWWRWEHDQKEIT